MVVVVMDDQGGGMFVQDSTISGSQGSYTSCGATLSTGVGRVVIWLVRGPVFRVSSNLLHLRAARAAPALDLIGRRDVVMTCPSPSDPSVLHHLTSCVWYDAALND